MRFLICLILLCGMVRAQGADSPYGYIGYNNDVLEISCYPPCDNGWIFVVQYRDDPQWCWYTCDWNYATCDFSSRPLWGELTVDFYYIDNLGQIVYYNSVTLYL